MTLATGVRFAGVLGVVKHQHVRAGGLGGDHTRVLRHVPRSVHLTLVDNLLLYRDLSSRAGCARRSLGRDLHASNFVPAAAVRAIEAVSRPQRASS